MTAHIAHCGQSGPSTTEEQDKAGRSAETELGLVGAAQGAVTKLCQMEAPSLEEHHSRQARCAGARWYPAGGLGSLTRGLSCRHADEQSNLPEGVSLWKPLGTKTGS